MSKRFACGTCRLSEVQEMVEVITAQFEDGKLKLQQAPRRGKGAGRRAQLELEPLLIGRSPRS